MLINDLANSLNVKKTNYYFWLFITIHTFIWTIGPFIFRSSLTHDTLEGITWGLQWQFGYNKHPFLTAWLCASICKLFNTIEWPIYLLAQLAVSATFFAAWELAKKFLPSTHALIASLILDGVIFYNINSFNLTPDTLQSPLWAFLALFFYNALTTQKKSQWFFTGLFAALCFCTKYQAVLLFCTMLSFCLFNKEARSSFKKSGIYLAIITFFLFISPHLIWLYTHDYITLYYAIETPSQYTHKHTIFGGLLNFIRYSINNLLDVICLFILLWPFYYKKKMQLTLNSFQWNFLIYISLGPLLLSLLLCLASGNYFPPRWSTPYFFSLGILMMVILRPHLRPTQIKQLTMTLIAYSSLLFLLKMGTIAFHVRPNSDAFLPDQQIALSLTKLWHDTYHTPLSYLAGSSYLVAITTPYMPDHPQPFFNWNIKDSPWIDVHDLDKKGALFVWDIGKNFVWDLNSANNTNLPKSIIEHYPNLIMLPKQIFYRNHDHYPILVGVAILPPKS